jgi:hypothetical protein
VECPPSGPPFTPEELQERTSRTAPPGKPQVALLQWLERIT